MRHKHFENEGITVKCNDYKPKFLIISNKSLKIFLQVSQYLEMHILVLCKLKLKFEWSLSYTNLDIVSTYQRE